MAVSWWITASGRAACTAATMASRSRASATAGSAPSARIASAFAGESGERRHVVAGRHERRDEPGAHHPAAACEEDPHGREV